MLLAGALAGLLLGGCAGQSGVAVDEPEDPMPTDDEGPGDGADAPPDRGADDPAAGSDAVLGAETTTAIDQVVADGADRDDVLVQEAEFVTWPDGALGCPDDDSMYTQALVEGYRIVLDVDGEPVTFHGADGEPPFRCDDPQPPVQ